MTVKLLHKEDGHVWGAYIPILVPRETMVEMCIEEFDLDEDGIDVKDIDYKRITSSKTEDGEELLEITEDDTEGVHSTVWIAE